MNTGEPIPGANPAPEPPKPAVTEVSLKQEARQLHDDLTAKLKSDPNASDQRRIGTREDPREAKIRYRRSEEHTS